MVALSVKKNLLTLVLVGILAGFVPGYVKGQSVADIVTQDFFNGIINQADASCAEIGRASCRERVCNGV